MIQETASKLVEIILDKNEKMDMREHAIYVLCGNIGEDLKYPDEVIDPIIKIALEEEYDNFRTHARARGRIQ